jgi:hypothetical protein
MIDVNNFKQAVKRGIPMMRPTSPIVKVHPDLDDYVPFVVPGNSVFNPPSDIRFRMNRLLPQDGHDKFVEMAKVPFQKTLIFVENHDIRGRFSGNTYSPVFAFFAGIVEFFAICGNGKIFAIKYDYDALGASVITALTALEVINHKAVTVETNCISEAVQKTRAEHGKPRLPDIRRIIVRDVKEVVHWGHEGSHSPKLPHDRRGHWRSLKDGRRVWVRNSRIHGGGSGLPKTYEVVA